MDTGEGYFEMYDALEEAAEAKAENPNAKGIFTEGGELEIRGSRFKVKEISPFGIKLKLLKKEEGRDES